MQSRQFCRGSCYEHLCNIWQSFSFIPHIASEELFWTCFLKFSLWVAMTTTQIERFGQKNMFGRGPLNKYFRKLLLKYLQWDKTMEILSCHSNKSTSATALKNILLVEANVMNVSVKFQLYPQHGFWDDFRIFFLKLSLSAAMATNQIQRFGQKWYVW